MAVESRGTEIDGPSKSRMQFDEFIAGVVQVRSGQVRGASISRHKCLSWVRAPSETVSVSKRPFLLKAGITKHEDCQMDRQTEPRIR